MSTADLLEFLRTMMRTLKGGGSGAEVVGPPCLDELFDGRAGGQFFVDDALTEAGEFGIAGETQRDQLVDRKLGDERLHVGRKGAFEAQAHFETDDTVLNGEREHAGVEGNQNESDRKEKRDDGIERNAKMDEAVNLVCEVQAKYGKRDQMECGNDAIVIGEILFFHRSTFLDIRFAKRAT